MRLQLVMFRLIQGEQVGGGIPTTNACRQTSGSEGTLTGAPFMQPHPLKVGKIKKKVAVRVLQGMMGKHMEDMGGRRT